MIANRNIKLNTLIDGETIRNVLNHAWGNVWNFFNSVGKDLIGKVSRQKMMKVLLRILTFFTLLPVVVTNDSSSIQTIPLQSGLLFEEVDNIRFNQEIEFYIGKIFSELRTLDITTKDSIPKFTILEKMKFESYSKKIDKFNLPENTSHHSQNNKTFLLSKDTQF
ncbi:hypothetical protein KQX54_011918 [Cotesia glomerata]|uniref:Uncharacterized protein n=1 Tax=Cotesia glomerata TaxID=32391 RepID=A0AAV7IWA4_COTGL|nr:hypothetical protein KQX54_011918 [Cotesia glomerata]